MAVGNFENIKKDVEIAPLNLTVEYGAMTVLKTKFEMSRIHASAE